MAPVEPARVASPPIPIRLGEPGDLAALENIERETAAMFPASALPPELALPLPAARLAEGMAESLLWVAHDPSAGPVGFVLCERRGTCLHVREMDVRPSFGRRGTGTRLLAQACDAARALGLRFVTLTTFSHLPWNGPFYASNGFTVPASLEPFPHLVEALRLEAELGLSNRVAMIKESAAAPTPQQLRIARPVSDLERTRTLYCQGLGLHVVGSFEDHAGFDGVMLGFGGSGYHFEFTFCRAHPVAPTPTPEDLVVFYVPTRTEWESACDRMVAAGFRRVDSLNPYWDLQGRTFQDPDGYRVVLQNAGWSDAEEAAPGA